MHNTLLLVVVVLTAISFDFTNGFHAQRRAVADDTHRDGRAIMGNGVGKAAADVRRGMAGRMVVASVVTLPAAALGQVLLYSSLAREAARPARGQFALATVCFAVAAVGVVVGVWFILDKR